MYNFEQFTTRHVSVSTPRVTLRKDATFALNPLALDLLGQPDYIVYLFDPDTRVVGFRPAAAKQPGAYRVKKEGKYRSCPIAAKSFCYHYSIDYSERRHFTPEMHDGVLVIKLEGRGE